MVDWSEDVLEAGFVDEYKRGIQFFHSHLVELHTNIFILEKVLVFPFRLLAGPDQIFFRQVIINFYDVSILTITRVAADQAGDLFTLPRFKNTVVQHIKDAHQEPFRKQLREVRFDEETEELLARARAIRNHRIAHITQQFASTDIEQLLDGIADKSRILRMPEQQPEWWQTYRLPSLTDAEKEQINIYRRKFGLTPI